jgi:hypothetical protein
MKPHLTTAKALAISLILDLPFLPLPHAISLRLLQQLAPLNQWPGKAKQWAVVIVEGRCASSGCPIGQRLLVERSLR